MNRAFLEELIANGLTYEAYQAHWQQQLTQSLKGLDVQARRNHFYRRYNQERAARVRAAYQPSEALQAALAEITEPQVWLVITEPWCADSAYALPILAAAADANPNLTLRLLLRDEHPAVMDRYLTRGGRAIPKLIAFAEEGTELFQWGARPQALYDLRDQWQAEGLAGAALSNAGVAWYDEGGWQEVDRELAEALACVGEPAAW